MSAIIMILCANNIIIQEQGYTVVNKMIICDHTAVIFTIFVSIAVSYKMIIHVIGLVLAFMTRKVNVDLLNDSKYFAALLYISCVLLTISILTLFLIVETNTLAAVWTTLLLLETCLFLGLNFIPKVLKLYFNNYVIIDRCFK